MREIESRLRALADFIRENNDDILSGSEVAIKKLENEVVGFCKWAADIEFDVVEPFIPEIEFLADYLKKISEHLNLDKESVMKQIDELNARRKAGRAYITGKKQ